MPSYTSLIRFIRRRLVLGFIFVLSLTYCAFSLFRNEEKSLGVNNGLDDMDSIMINEKVMSDNDIQQEQLRVSGKPPLWQMEILDTAIKDTIDVSNLNDSDVSIQSCRNSIQGKALIVDERGTVCARKEVLSNGCCKLDEKQILNDEEPPSVIKRERYSCKTCNSQGCCTIYEYCVSCCLHPGKQIKGRKDLVSGPAKAQKDEDAIRKRIRNLDRFQICLAICRTSSASVRHENTYKDPLAKHCYARQSLSTHSRHRRDINALNNSDNSFVVVTTSSSVMTLLTNPSSKCHFLNSLNEARIIPCTNLTLMLTN